MEATTTMTMERFSGIDNVTPATRLISARLPNGCPVWPLQAAVNVDIDDAYRIKSRLGWDELATGTDLHSLWADAADAFYVDLTSLKRLLSVSPFQSLVLGSVKAGARLSYARVNDRVYWTNGFAIGYVRGNVMSALVDPGLAFKQSLPAGQLIASYRACLFVARDNILYASDPLCDHFDVRSQYRQFSSPITLLCSVDTGLYVGDEEKVYWLQGDAMEEFGRIEAYPRAAIFGTDVRVPGQFLGKRGTVAVWTGTDGICVGDGSGLVENWTEAVYGLDGEYVGGAGLVRENGSIRHYINSLF